MKITDESMHAALQRWRDEDHEETIALSREQVIDLCEEYRAALTAALSSAGEREETRQARVEHFETPMLAEVIEKARRGEIEDNPPSSGREPQTIEGYITSPHPTSADKPEVVAFLVDCPAQPTLEFANVHVPDSAEPLIRLSDYEALRAENERLRIERITAERDAADYMKRLNRAVGKLAIADNVIAELVKALEPFADAKITYLDAPDGREVKAKHVHGLVYGDFRRARAALGGQSNE